MFKKILSATVLMSAAALLGSLHLYAQSAVIQVENGQRVLVINGASTKSNWVELMVEGRYDVAYYGGSVTYFDVSCPRARISAAAYRHPLAASRYTAPKHLCIFIQTAYSASFSLYYMGAFIYNPPAAGSTYHIAVALSDFDAIRYVGGAESDAVQMMVRSNNLGIYLSQPYTAYGNGGRDYLYSSPGPSILYGGDGDDWMALGSWGSGSGKSYSDYVDGGAGTDHVDVYPKLGATKTTGAEDCRYIGIASPPSGCQ